MRKIHVILFLGLMVIWAGAAPAKTPDGLPPSVETVCDNETGAAFGLCNAYCEAMDCDSPNHHASDIGCASVRQSFEKKTGRPMPCEVTCPCPELLDLFGDILSGEARVEQCLTDSTLLSVITETGDFVLISAGPPPFCSVNLEVSVELTATEELVCRVLLRTASEAQGVPCVSPE